MRVLLSTIGSRGDVQPLVALASELRALGQDVRVCVPPDFREWIESLKLAVVPIGPELRSTASPSHARPTAGQWPQLVEGTIATQFATIAEAAQGCDVILAGGALNIAARSIAEKMGIGYVYASYCPISLPSPHHAPPAVARSLQTPTDGPADNRTLWAKDAEHWNGLFGPAFNSHRAAIDLAPVNDGRNYIFTDRPWLAADPTLAPWPEPDGSVVQTGAWILPDGRPLPPELVTFLEVGDPPIYFGFGSIRAPEGLAQVMIQSARALGRRAIVSRGWADLSPVDDEPDCLSIGEVNQEALFKQVAAVVHHGGAGTTTAAARAGAPQVVIPQHYDQFYWAGRVQHLGIGTAHAPGAPTVESLTAALRHTLEPALAAHARAIGAAVRTDGARVAAQRLVS